MSDQHIIPATLQWIGGIEGRLRIIDQTRLPVELIEIDLETVEQVIEAIRSLRVRGAPAIGVAAAYGVVERDSNLDMAERVARFLLEAGRYRAIIAA